MTGAREPRVFVGLVEVAGFYSRLATGFRRAGVPCTLCLLSDHPFEYRGAARLPHMLRPVRALMGKLAKARSERAAVRALLWRAAGFVARIALFAEVAVAHDVFVFGFGQTFFRGLDLRLLRLFGRKVILVFNGSDHRPPYLNGVTCRTSEDASTSGLRDETARVKRLVTSLESHADAVIAHHLSAQFHERPFVPSTAIGLPCDILELPPQEPRHVGAPVRVIHAPSNPEAKGTDQIRAAISRLSARGYAIAYVEISGRPNVEVLTALQDCDLVVDELYSDARMAGLASEAAMFAKPVVVAGYAADAAMRVPGIVEVEDFPPVLYCRPEEIEEAIETLVRDPEARQRLGSRARRYVETHWSAERVALRLLETVREGGRTVARVDPKGLRYFHGFGLRESVLAEVLRAYADCWGEGALYLDDKPELLAAVRQFCADGAQPGHG